jgi:hypothetical protein
VLEVLGSELESNWVWKLAHSACLFLTIVLLLSGCFYCQGFAGNVSGFVSGASTVFFTCLVLFYQKRDYAVRQAQSQILLKRNKLGKQFD